MSQFLTTPGGGFPSHFTTEKSGFPATPEPDDGISGIPVFPSTTQDPDSGTSMLYGFSMSTTTTPTDSNSASDAENEAAFYQHASLMTCYVCSPIILLLGLVGKVCLVGWLVGLVCWLVG